MGITQRCTGSPSCEILALGTAGLLITAAAIGSATAQPFPEATVSQLQEGRERLPELVAWIDGTGLGSALEVLRLRRARHPDADTDRRILRLETRWLQTGEDRDQALAFYATFDERFATVNGQRFGEKLLFKLVHLLGVPVRDAAVHVHVLDTDVATFVTAAGEIVTRDSPLRSVRARTDVTLPGFEGAIPALVAPASTSFPTADLPDMQQLVQFLAGHYQGARFRHTVLESDYLGFEVDELRGTVISGAGYWEHIEGGLYVLREPREVRLRLHLDGRYAASGLGSRPPDRSDFKDMETVYTAALQTYANELVLIVRQALIGERIGGKRWPKKP